MAKTLMRQSVAIAWLRNTHATATPDTCILWPQGVDKDGYGQTIWMVNGVKQWVRLHRFSLEMHAGPPPADKPIALHSCHTPRCVNPFHLRWGTVAENNRDRNNANRCKKSRLTLDQVIQLSNVHGQHRKALAEQFGISYNHSRTLILQLRRGKINHLR